MEFLATHRLTDSGLGQRGAVLVMYALEAFFGLLALLVNKLSILQAYVLAFVVVLASLLTTVILEKVSYERQ